MANTIKHGFKNNIALHASGKKKEGTLPSSFLCYLLRLSLTQLMTVVGHAVLAHSVRKAELTALGAGRDARSLQLPHGAAALIPTLLGHFTLRDCHL